MILWPDSVLSRTTKRAPKSPAVITVLEYVHPGLLLKPYYHGAPRRLPRHFTDMAKQ